MYPPNHAAKSSNVTLAGVNVTWATSGPPTPGSLAPPLSSHNKSAECILSHTHTGAASTTDMPDCWGTSPPPDMTQSEVNVLATILVAVFMTSLVANAFVVMVFSKRRASLSISNRFLANLTLCNCLFTLLVMPPAFVSLVTRDWLFGSVLCQCTGLAMNLLVSASIFTLAIISCDRYCAVVTPLHYSMRLTRRRCWAFIAGIWGAALVVSFPPLVGWNFFHFHLNLMVCTVSWASHSAADRYYTLFLVSLSFVLPLMER